MSALPILVMYKSLRVGLITRIRDRELGLDRRETGWLLSNGCVSSLRGRWLQYERNELSAPLVDRLSDKAVPGSYALGDKG